MSEIDFKLLFTKMVECGAGVALVSADEVAQRIYPNWFEAPEKANGWITEPRDNAWFVVISHYIGATIAVITLSSPHNSQGAYICTWASDGGGNHDQSPYEVLDTIRRVRDSVMPKLQRMGDVYNAIRNDRVAARNLPSLEAATRTSIKARKEKLEADIAESGLIIRASDL